MVGFFFLLSKIFLECLHWQLSQHSCLVQGLVRNFSSMTCLIIARSPLIYGLVKVENINNEDVVLTEGTLATPV